MLHLSTGHLNGINTATDEGQEDDLLLAARLMWACYYLYYGSPSGIAFDSVNFQVWMVGCGQRSTFVMVLDYPA